MKTCSKNKNLDYCYAENAEVAQRISNWALPTSCKSSKSCLSLFLPLGQLTLDHELTLDAGESQQHQPGFDRCFFGMLRLDRRLVLVGLELSFNFLIGAAIKF